MKISGEDIVLIEDHDEALRVWREKKIKGLDLVHIDAHIDLEVHRAKPLEKVLNEARNLKELKKNLEYSLAFMRYEKNLDNQTHIGNYIYPAIEEGIVKDFYWVIPGGLKEFKKSKKLIKNILSGVKKSNSRKAPLRLEAQESDEEGIISAELLGRRFIVCTLERLPVLKQDVLLDIDTDFLIIDSLLNAENTDKVGERKPWIQPQNLVESLNNRVKNPCFITIAYSVNGGWTPMKYKHLGNEIFYHLAPKRLKKGIKKSLQAAEHFNLFTSTGEEEHYQKAVRLDPSYRAADNNYGDLYMSLRKFSLAQREYSRILGADPGNPACLTGLGNIALERSDFRKARRLFFSALDALDNGRDRRFDGMKKQSLLGLARAEFGLRNYKKAKELLINYQALEPLDHYSCYLLGRICEKEREFPKAVNFYKDAIRLGCGSIEPISRLARISYYLKEKSDIIKYLGVKYKEFKKGFERVERWCVKKEKKIIGVRGIKKEMRVVEKRLKAVS